MIQVFEGTPGSGKTLHATEEAIIAMRGRPGGVVANFPIRRPRLRPDGTSKWIHRMSDELTPAFLVEHARRYHRVGKESEGLLIIDECHEVLNSRRTWQNKSTVNEGQLQLVQFLATSRHFGYDVLLVVQNLRMLDSQARMLAELRVKHFKWNTFWFLRWCPVPIFGRVTYNAQFPGMKGRLSFSTGMMAYGRYDHQTMRQSYGARWAGGSGAYAPAPATLSLVRQPADDDARASVKEDRQSS